MSQAKGGGVVAVGRDPLLESYRELRQIHRMFAGAARALEQGIGRPACIPNCGLCCIENTPVWMTIEAIHAVSVLTGEGKLAKATSICEGWLRDKSINGTRLTIFEGIPIGWASPKLREEWYTVSRGPCPFLNEDKTCFVWGVRPLACRAYAVTRDTVNPQTGVFTCPRPPGKGETVSQKLVVDGTPIRETVRQLRERLKERNKVWLISGAVPSLLYRVIKPELFKKMALDGEAASAKLVGTEFETSLMWQPQVVALRKGISPDLAALAR